MHYKRLKIISNAQNNANAIIQKPIRSVNEVKQTLQEVQQLNNQLTSAIDQLQSLANNSGLKAAKNKLESKINENILTDGMTTQSIQSFNNAKMQLELKYKLLMASLMMVMLAIRIFQLR